MLGLPHPPAPEPIYTIVNSRVHCVYADREKASTIKIRLQRFDWKQSMIRVAPHAVDETRRVIPFHILFQTTKGNIDVVCHQKRGRANYEDAKIREVKSS